MVSQDRGGLGEDNWNNESKVPFHKDLKTLLKEKQKRPWDCIGIYCENKWNGIEKLFDRQIFAAQSITIKLCKTMLKIIRQTKKYTCRMWNR